MSVTPRLVADFACRIGEGPLWHAERHCVYWTDIPAGRLFRLDVASGAAECCYEGRVVGGFTLQADGQLLLFLDRGGIGLWDGQRLELLRDELPAEASSRFNDVIADPAGRVFCGTMCQGSSPGRLYRLDLDGTLEVVVDGVGCSNGLGFTPDREGLYYTDSVAREIDRFDYDQATGAIANRRPFVRTPAGEGVPDGMTVDAAGCVWSARWDGGCLVQYSPAGELLQRIEFPARKVSSVTFGGPDGSDLWVTTAGGDAKATEGAGAGALFHLNLGILGGPEFRSRIGL
ncbi:MAG: SMP-30/gluconolactonase/LRE family protein [Fimbriimonadaceae bacterium]|nr:SMP-30/gluconolactonase/LRE family protein [Fimbriimonadaceae bacterium]